MTESLNLCVDCKHHSLRFVAEVDQVVEHHVCNREAAHRRDPVTGTEELKGWLYCVYERGEAGGCGPEGKFWEKKGD